MIRLIVLFMCLFFLYGKMFSQDKEQYLSNNCMILSDSSINNNGLKQMDSDISKNMFFLIGESHDGIKNGEIKSLIIKKISNTSKAVHLIMECPFSLEYSFKKYVFEGDTLEYKTIEKASRFLIEEEMFFLRELRLLVKKGYKIKISTIDLEVNYNITLNRLNELIPDDTIPLNIEEIINSIQKTEYSLLSYGMTSLENECFVALANNLDKALKENETDFRVFFKENYQEFVNISNRYLLTTKCKSGSKIENAKMRELVMYSNCLSVVKDNPGDTFVGLFGIGHATLQPISAGFFGKRETLAFMLNNNKGSLVKNLVCPIAINYLKKKESYYFFSRKDFFLFLEYSKTPLTLFKLNGESSPFKKLEAQFKYIVNSRY